MKPYKNDARNWRKCYNTSNNRPEILRVIKILLFSVAKLLTLNFVFFIFVFNFSDNAYLYNGMEGDFCGPVPHSFLCKPTYHNFYYSGNEWPFWLFRIPCVFWVCIMK